VRKKSGKRHKSIGMVKTTIKNEEGDKQEIRYYISSMGREIENFEVAV
jgi:hypothetical protein